MNLSPIPGCSTWLSTSAWQGGRRGGCPYWLLHFHLHPLTVSCMRARPLPLLSHPHGHPLLPQRGDQARRLRGCHVGGNAHNDEGGGGGVAENALRGGGGQLGLGRIARYIMCCQERIPATAAGAPPCRLNCCTYQKHRGQHKAPKRDPKSQAPGTQGHCISAPAPLQGSP